MTGPAVREQPPVRTSDAVREFFTVQGLSPDAAHSLAEVSRVRHRDRGEEMRLVVGRSFYFLIEGRVAEASAPGKVRLWRDVLLFENMNMAGLSLSSYRSSRPKGAHVVSGRYLTACLLVEVPVPVLNAAATADPTIAMMLARMTAKRLVLTERLYTATRATPTARVATMLDYLAEPVRKKVVRARRRDGVLIMTSVEEIVAQGPTQSDLADALCLGRATVEKALAELRQTGALRAFEPGERTNRCYVIEDRRLLKQIAQGG